MDILTPAGQKTIPQERQLIKSFEAKWPSFRCIPSASDLPSALDGFVERDGIINAVYESKCRKVDSKQLAIWNNQWLVTYNKIKIGAEIAAHFNVPLIGLLFLLNEPIGLCIKITDEFGQFLPHILIKPTTTQSSINGGSVVRSNAFICMKTAKSFPILT